MDWEDWLRKSCAPPSATEDEKRQRTEQQIKDALRKYEPLKGKDYVVYTKGSYANNTNVRLNYDVDIAVEYRGYFYSELCFDLAGQSDSVVGIYSTADPYTRGEFKKDVEAALRAAFGTSAVSSGHIAYRVREGKTTLPADVVPSWEFRRYDRIVNGTPLVHEGTCVFPTGGSRKVNYPSRQLRNGNDKNSRTGKRYKRMVRALKRLQTRVVQQGALANALPSYLIECLVYNVPDAGFNHEAYLSDMQFVLATISNATKPGGNWESWEEVHGLHYLFTGTTSWTYQQAHGLADACWDHLGLG
jgi:predicted nucleotidyltransferase